MHRTFVSCVILVWILLAMGQPALAGKWFLRMEADGGQVDGIPLSWDQKDFYLLRRDGQIKKYSMSLAKNAQRIPQPFREFSQSEMKAQLASEFGRRFEVTPTGNYLIAHPIGESQKWPRRFEQLYREMLVYFRTRGMNVAKPKFPMVAIVFPSQREFMEYGAQEGFGGLGGVLGFYSHLSNRIYLYDESAGGQLQSDWRRNAETIVHEAVHQTAFNTGLHKRMSECPKWVIEGLGCLFEAPGVYDASRHRDRFERVNRDQLATYKRSFTRLPKNTLAALVGSDDLFQQSPGAAYTLSWALSFMMAETEPSQYAEYVRVTSRYRPFRAVSAAQRLRDFQSVFGNDLDMIQSRMHRYITSLE